MFESSNEARIDIMKNSIYLKPKRLTTMIQNRAHHTSSHLKKGVLIMNDVEEDEDDDDIESQMVKVSVDGGSTVGRLSIQEHNEQAEEVEDTETFMERVGGDDTMSFVSSGTVMNRIASNTTSIARVSSGTEMMRASAE